MRISYLQQLDSFFQMTCLSPNDFTHINLRLIYYTIQRAFMSNAISSISPELVRSVRAPRDSHFVFEKTS